MNLSIKKEPKDPNETVQPPILSPVYNFSSEMNTVKVLNSGANFICNADVLEPTNLFQNEAPLPLPISSKKATTPKKGRSRRKRYVYSKPKKKKKKEAPQTLVDTLNVFDMQQLVKSKGDNLDSDCSSDTIIVDDLSEEISNHSINAAKKLSEEVELQAPELGKLLISSGMFTDSNEMDSTKKKNTSIKSGVGNSKVKHSGNKQLEPLCNLGRNQLFIKEEGEESPVQDTKSCELPSVLNQVRNISPVDKVAEEPSATSFLVSPSVSDISPPETKKRRPQTARRGRKKFVSSERAVNEQIIGETTFLTEASIITNQVKSTALENDLIPSQYHVNVEETLPTSNFFETYVVEMPKKKKPAAKRSTPKKKAPTSVFLNDSSLAEASSFPLIAASNKTSFPSDYATGFVLPEDVVVQKSSRKKPAPKRKPTKKTNAKQLSSELEENSFCISPPAKKARGKAPNKRTPKKSPMKKLQETTFLNSEHVVETNLVISVKKELAEDSCLGVTSLKQRQPNMLKQTAGAPRMDSDSNAMSSRLRGNSKTYVSLSFEEETSKEETDESLSLLLSLRKRRSVTENSRASKVLKKDHNITDVIKNNVENTSNLSIDSILSDPKQQLETAPKERLKEGMQNLKLCRQPNTLNIDVSKVKKENENGSAKNVTTLEDPETLDKSISSESFITKSIDCPDSHIPNLSNRKCLKTVLTSSDKSPVNLVENAVLRNVAIKKELEDCKEISKSGPITRLSNDNAKVDGRKMTISLANSSEPDLSVLSSTFDVSSVPTNKRASKCYQEIQQLESPSVKAKANVNSTSQSLLINSNTSDISSCNALSNSAPAQNTTCASSCNNFMNMNIKKEPQAATSNTVNVVYDPSNCSSGELKTKEQLISEKLNASNLINTLTSQPLEKNLSSKAGANFADSSKISWMQDSDFNSSCTAAASIKQEVYCNIEKNILPTFHENTTLDKTCDGKSSIPESSSSNSNIRSSIDQSGLEVINRNNTVTSSEIVEIPETEKTQSLLGCLSGNTNKNVTPSFCETNIKENNITYTIPSAFIKKEIRSNLGLKNSSDSSCHTPVLKTINDTIQSGESIESFPETQDSSSRLSSKSLEGKIKQETFTGACFSFSTAKQDKGSSFKTTESNVLDSVSNLSPFRAKEIGKEVNSDLVVAPDSMECDNLLIKEPSLILEEENTSSRTSLTPRPFTPSITDSLRATDSVSPSLQILENSMDSLQTPNSITVPALTTEEEIIGKFDIFLNFRKKVNIFFKHPHPGDSILKFTQVSEPKSDYYSRLQEVSSNVLTFEEVANRLKMAVANGFASVKDENSTVERNFPLSKEEIGCYHKLLCVVPSLNLISQHCNSPTPPESITLTDESITVGESEIIRLPSPPILESNEVSLPDQNDKESGDLSSFNEKCVSFLGNKTREADIPLLNEQVSPPLISSPSLLITEKAAEHSDSTPLVSQDLMNVLENLKSKVQQMDELKDSEVDTEIQPHRSQDTCKEMDENRSTSHLEIILLENFKSNVLQFNKLSEHPEKGTEDVATVFQDVCRKLDETTPVSFTGICTDSSSSISLIEDSNSTSTFNDERNTSFTKASENLSEMSGNSSVSISAVINNQKTLSPENNMLSHVQNAIKDINLPSKEMLYDLIQTTQLKATSENKTDYLTSQNSKIISIGLENSVECHPEKGVAQVPQEFLVSNESSQQLPSSTSTPTPLSLFLEASHMASDGSQLFSSDKNLLSTEHSDQQKDLMVPNIVEKSASDPTVNYLTEERSSLPLQFPTLTKNVESYDFRNDRESHSAVRNTIPVLSNVDVQTTELLKILQAANTLPSSEDRGFHPSSVNFEDTYDSGDTSLAQNSLQQGYNRDLFPDNRYLNASDYSEDYHFRDSPGLIKIPVVRDYGHKSVTDINCKDHSSYAGTVLATNETINHACDDVSTFSRHSYASDSDVDNEFLTTDAELHNESTYDNEGEGVPAKKLVNENNNTKKEDAKSKPQYKSRWEKIMERKSLEAPSKSKFNEHLLKDCYPVKKLSRVKPNIGKPIAHVQPCSQKITKIPSKVKKFSSESRSVIKIPSKVNKFSSESQDINKIPLKVNKFSSKSQDITKIPLKVNKFSSESQDINKIPLKVNKFSSESQNTSFKIPKKTKKGKVVPKSKGIFKNKKNIKSPLKNKTFEDTSLFQPDKVIKKNEVKADCSSGEKIIETDASNRFYGRITNRGTFLTQSSINQPPKSKAPVGKKSVDKVKGIPEVPTDKFHLMIHSPRIEISAANKILPNQSHKPSWKSNFSDPRLKTDCSDPRLKIDMSPNAGFSSASLFLRPKRKNSIDTLSSMSPDITLQSSNDSSNFFSTPESVISSNLSISVLPNIQQDQSCLPYNTVSLPNTGLKISQTSKRTLLPTPPSIFPMKTKNRFLLPSPSHPKFSNLSQNLPSNELDLDISSPAIRSPSVTGSPIDFNLESPILNCPPTPQSPAVPSTVHLPSRSGQHRHSRSRHTRCVCLPPRMLKASVGNAVFETIHVLLLILEWNVDWLVQQQKNHDPPPISNSVKKVVNTYEDSDEYYNTYLPLMLLETWQRIYMSWTHLHQASPYFCEVKSYTVETHSIKVECQAIFKASDAERGIFPEEGNIIMVKFATKEKGGIKILGYVREVKVKDFDINTDPQNVCCRTIKYTPGEQLQMLLLTFAGAYTSDDFDINQLIRIQILCNIKTTLKQNDAMLNLKNSPLSKNVLNPLNDGLRMVTVVTRNTDPVKMSDSVSECVRDIVTGILSPHPLPLLTIAKSLPSSDRLLVLPPLIEKMKNSYKTKVLLCTRTSKALTDIGFNLVTTGTIRIVIIGKRTDVHQKLRKYLLEDLAAKRLRSSSEDPASKDDTKSESLENAKMDVLRNCDVILSLIRNCHNDLVAQTFADGDCIAQMCCIIDEANLCTEPEILIPLLYGISKLILIGDPDVPAKVCSKAASNYDYSRSLFHRAYELDRTSE